MARNDTQLSQKLSYITPGKFFKIRGFVSTTRLNHLPSDTSDVSVCTSIYPRPHSSSRSFAIGSIRGCSCLPTIPRVEWTLQNRIRERCTVAVSLINSREPRPAPSPLPTPIRNIYGGSRKSFTVFRKKYRCRW